MPPDWIAGVSTPQSQKSCLLAYLQSSGEKLAFAAAASIALGNMMNVPRARRKLSSKKAMAGDASPCHGFIADQ